jgi:hypothetical protein
LNMTRSCLGLFRWISSRLTSAPSQCQQFSEPDRKSHSTCVQRQFACSEQKWSSYHGRMECGNVPIKQSYLFLKIRIGSYFQFIAFIPFDASSDMHFHMSCNKDNSMMWKKESFFVWSVSSNTGRHALCYCL